MNCFFRIRISYWKLISSRISQYASTYAGFPRKIKMMVIEFSVTKIGISVVIETLCMICYHLFNFKNMKNTNGRVILLVILLCGCFWSFLKNNNGNTLRAKHHVRSNWRNTHCVKSVQIWSFFWSAFSRIRTEYGEILRTDTPYLFVFSPNAGKYKTEKTPYLDTFHAV